MTGIAIGLAVMVIAVLIIAGFKGEMRTKIVGFGSHIQISGLEAVNMYDAVPVVVDDTLMRLVACYPDVKHVQRYSIKPGMVKTDDSFQGMILKGLGQEYDTTFSINIYWKDGYRNLAIRYHPMKYWCRVRLLISLSLVLAIKLILII